MINFDVLGQYLDNDPDIIEAVLMAYMEEHADSAETLNTHYQNEDWEQVFITAHSLKGILSGFGEEKAVPLLVEVEASSREGNSPSQEHIDTIANELRLIKQQIEQHFSSL